MTPGHRAFNTERTSLVVYEIYADSRRGSIVFVHFLGRRELGACGPVNAGTTRDQLLSLSM